MSLLFWIATHHTWSYTHSSDPSLLMLLYNLDVQEIVLAPLLSGLRLASDIGRANSSCFNSYRWCSGSLLDGVNALESNLLCVGHHQLNAHRHGSPPFVQVALDITAHQKVKG